MPSLKRIRTRIASVKNTQKITRAMKLVAAARLRRAQEAIVAARPYAERLQEVITDIAARAQEGKEAAHPLLEQREAKRVQLILVTSDRGLAGGLNSNLTRRVERFLVDNATRYPVMELIILGRKGRDHFRRRKVSVSGELPGANSDTARERARHLAAQVTRDYLDGKADEIYLVYNRFKSAISQLVMVEPLLPVHPAELPMGAGRIDFEYEPSKQALLSTLIPLYLEVQLYRVLLESIASEFGARMSAMDSATNNAREMIGRLTLDFNRARQAAITKELMEIVGGAEALKG